MIKLEKFNCLSERFNKKEKDPKNLIYKERISNIKNNRKINSNFLNNYNQRKDFIGKDSNLFEQGKLIDKHHINKKFQFIKIKNINSEGKFDKKINNNFSKDDKMLKIRNTLFSKKKLLYQIIQEDSKNISKDKLNPNPIYNNYYLSLKNRNKKDILLINNMSMPELEINKKNVYNFKNDIEDSEITNYSCFKGFEDYNKKLLKETSEQNNLKKTSLFKKIKFISLKKFCNKEIKFNGLNKNMPKNFFLFNQNSLNKNSNKINLNSFKNLSSNTNNCNETTINSIKEKVRNYFIGKFQNIKEYFDDWDIKGAGILSLNDIYKYLNNKIKFKISKDEVNKLLESYLKKNYFDLEYFKFFFFEEPSNEKLSIILNKNVEHNKTFKKTSSDTYLLYNKKKDINISFYEKSKYFDLIDLIKEQKDKIILEKLSKRGNINKNGEELNYNDFCNFINKIIKYNTITNYDNEIKELFVNYKLKNCDKINIMNFIEEINNKQDIIIKSNNLINNKEDRINLKYSTFDNKFKNNLNTSNNNKKSSKIIIFNKNSITRKANYTFKTNQNNKEYEQNEINKTNLIKISNNQNLKNEKIKDNIKNSKINRERNFNEKFTITHQNIEKNQFCVNNYPKLLEFKLPKITKNMRDLNKNADIIDLL